MIQAQNIRSLTDFQRNTAGHVRRLKETGMPEVLTVKGKAELVIQDAEAYQDLLNRLELYESAGRIVKGLQEISEGRGSSLEGFESRFSEKHPRS